MAVTVAEPETEKSHDCGPGNVPVPVTVRSADVALVMTPVALAVTLMPPAHVKLNVPTMFVAVWVEMAHVKLPHPVTWGGAEMEELQVPTNAVFALGVEVVTEVFWALGRVDEWS